MRQFRCLLIATLAIFGIQNARAADTETLLVLADHFADLDNWLAACPLYTRAERELHSHGNTERELYARFGRMHCDLQEGSYFSVAEQVKKELDSSIVQRDPSLHIRALALKGIIDLNLNTAAAQDDFSQIQSIARSIADRKWENRASGDLGLVAGAHGDVGSAAMALLKAIRTAAELDDVAAQILFSTWLANGMTVHGMADKAIPLLDRTLGLVSKTPDAGFPVLLYIAKVRALVSLAETGGTERTAEAKQLIDVALKFARENEILGAQSELLNQAGLLALRAHDLSGAERSFRQTVNTAKRANLPRMEGEGFLHLAQIYEQQRDWSRALAAIDSGIREVRLVQENFDLPVYLARKAEVEAALGNTGSADRLYEQASDLIEAMLVNAPSSLVKSSMIAALSDIYVGRFRLALSRLHNPAEAFRIIEAARGRALADSIRYASRSTAFGGTTEPERDIAAIQKRLRESPVSPAETRVLLAKLDQVYDKLAAIEYQRNRPEMTMARRPPVSISLLQHSLAPGEILVEYVLDSKADSHALEITSSAIRVHAIPSRAEVNNLCQNFIRTVKSKAKSSEAGRALFDRVFLAALSGHPTAVVIVPDGPLNLVPFAALSDQDGQYLARSIAVSFAPSATVFHILRTARRSSEPPKPFLGVAYSPANPGTQPLGQHTNARGLESALASLKPLPFVRDEVLSAARVAGSQSVVLVGEAATESALKAQPLRSFKVIHLAMHGFGHLTEPDRAGLVLAPGDPNEDGLWQAREIRESRLSADLVTLSACETGSGRLQGEEGIMNLARTFLVAGAKSVVASLWDVDDRSTATLMTHFYREVAAGKGVAEALRAAQLRILTEFGADMPPYYWAGFTVIGDGKREISFTTTSAAVDRAASVNIR